MNTKKQLLIHDYKLMLEQYKDLNKEDIKRILKKLVKEGRYTQKEFEREFNEDDERCGIFAYC